MQRLKGKVAVVTGATRGAGRGIAVELGEAGATVYVTGRSIRGALTKPDLPGTTIEDTAEQVTAQGGVGIPVCCDHTVDAQVEALFERVKQEQGRLDILVNNAWGGYENMKNYDAPFWEQPIWRWDVMFDVGARAHFTASRFAVPLMLPHHWGLIVSTTYGEQKPRHISPLSKLAVNGLVYMMAYQLRSHDIAVVGVAPGWMRTEAVLRDYKTDEQNWHKVPALRKAESTQYTGRAVAALAADPNVVQKTGCILLVGDLAREYGFTDIDGRYVPPFNPDEE